MNKTNYQYMYDRVQLLNYDAKDVKTNAAINMRYMLNRTRRAFRHNNLPESIPERNLELMIQANGYVGIIKHEGKYYAVQGGLGGPPNPYYMPTLFIVANPALKLSKTYTIGVDCAIIPNDTLYMGLRPMLSKYCLMMAENELTMNVVDVLARSSLVITADDDKEFLSAEDYIKKLKDGELGVITSDNLLSGKSVDVQPGATASANVITNLIEYEQYLKASMFNELGLNANWNAKRETITSSESLLNSDTLLPLIDDMLECRKKGWEDVKKVFPDLDVEVELNSAWEDNMEEIELEQELMRQEVAAIDEAEEVEESLEDQEVVEDETKKDT